METRENVISYIETTKEKTEISLKQLLKMLGLRKSKYYNWKTRSGIENHHNSNLPKSNWLLEEEREAIIEYAKNRMSENEFILRDGYRRLCYRMIDEDIVAVSPSTVYRVLSKAGLLNKWSTKKTSGKGKGFTQPLKAHDHWHIDIKYVNFKGTFLFLISIIDGYSRYIVHHRLCKNMMTRDVEITLEKALEKFPDYKPRIISDNGSQFISKDFSSYLKIHELNQVRTSVAYPQSNGKIERFHRSINNECLKIKSFIDIKDAREQIKKYVDFYNTRRLHSALHYLTPEDFLLGRVEQKIVQRNKKLEQAFLRRKTINNQLIAA